MRPTSLIAIACLTIVSLTVGVSSAPSREPPDDWRSWLASEAAGFSGVALIARNETVDVEEAFGLAEHAAGRPNVIDTCFNLGSINKTFTAVSVAQLIERGRLALDDTLLKFLPEYPDKDAAARISIRQLLTHRSGVAQFVRADFGDISVAQMTKLVAREPLAFEPGTRQMYSNGGYVLLGRVIEVASGRSYADYIADHIYRPAGMTASGFVKSGDRTQNVAVPVASAAMGGVASGTGARQVGPGNPAGGGYSTTADLFRFARALRSGRLLGPAMTQYVLEDTFAEDPAWGFALREQHAGQRRFIGNGGGAPGVNAEFRFEPTGEYSVVVLSNTSPPAATRLLTAILNRIAGVSTAPFVQPAPAHPLGSASSASLGEACVAASAGED